MYKNVLESISGISIFPIIGLLIFFAVFLVILYRVVYRTPKEYIKKMENLPLDSSNFRIIDGE